MIIKKVWIAVVTTTDPAGAVEGVELFGVSDFNDKSGRTPLPLATLTDPESANMFAVGCLSCCTDLSLSVHEWLAHTSFDMASIAGANRLDLLRSEFAGVVRDACIRVKPK